jgi:hypothetical protein
MFVVKTYSRKELALLYFPESPTPKAACLNFRRWMLEKEATAELQKELHHKRLFTRSDVQRIVDLLGEP